MPKPHLTLLQSAQFRPGVGLPPRPRSPPRPPEHPGAPFPLPSGVPAPRRIQETPQTLPPPSERHWHPPQLHEPALTLRASIRPSVSFAIPTLPTADTPGGPDTPPHALGAPDAFLTLLLTLLWTLRIRTLGMLSNRAGCRAGWSGRAGGRNGFPATKKGGRRSGGVVCLFAVGRLERDVAPATCSPLNQWKPNNGPHESIARRTPDYLISNDNPRLVSRIDQYGTSATVHRN